MGCKTINVICDDTDVFVPLAHYFAEESLSVSLIMVSTSRSRSSIDIGATVAKHSGIVPQLIAAHAVSGCETVGIGKTEVVKSLSAGIELNHLGDPKSRLDDVMKESTHFIGACYGQKCDPSDTMSSIRYKVWVSCTGRKGASILPKLKSLPPTVEAFRENVKRAHFQVCIWKAALQQDPSELDPLEFGWASEGPSGAYFPVSLPSKVEFAPSDILKLINCSCSSDRPCSSQRCSCLSAQLALIVHCSASVKAAQPAAIPRLFP